MANRFKKMIQPLLDEARGEGYKAGHEQGMKDGFQKKTLAYENEIECLKTLVAKLEDRIPAVPGPEIADPNIMELCFHNGERHMKEKVITMLQDVLDQADGFCMIDVAGVIKAVEDI
jgi:hypothetical protein